MRSVLTKSDADFRAEMRGLDTRLETMLRDFSQAGVQPLHRAWARDALEAASRAVRTGSRSDRAVLDSILRSPPPGMDRRLMDQTSSAVDAALSAPVNTAQREAVAQALERVANEIFSGSLPGQGPPAGMLDRYRQVMKGVPRRTD